MSKLVPKIVPGDWNAVAYAIAKLDAKLNTGASPTFKSIGSTDLTASRLVATNASKALASSDLNSWVTGTANQVNIADDGDGTVTFSTPQDIHTSAYPVFINTNIALSPMIMTGGAVSEGTDAGTIKVGALTAMLRTTTPDPDPESGTLTRITLAEQDNITLGADDTFYYIVLTYGDPCTITASVSNGNGTTSIEIGHCLKEADGTRHYSSAGLRLFDGVRKLHRRASRLRSIEKGSGCSVSNTGTRNLFITAGYFHRGVNQYSFTQKDTSDTDTFDYYYYNPTSAAWVKDDNTGSHYTALDNVQYNNVDAGTGLTNLTVNKYTTNWVFVHPDDGHIIVVYGRTNGTLTGAENENIPPSLPPVIDNMAGLLAKVIVKEGSNTLIVENVEYYRFSPDISVDHNELQGLQGGTANEYYHFTSAEHILISAMGGLTPTNGNFIVGDGSTWIAESGATARASLGLTIGTHVQAHGDVLDDLNILGTNAADSEFLVGTGAGALAWESGDTVRTSLALGSGDSPTFAALSLGTGELTCGSINRATGTLTLEIAGTPQISITSTGVTFAGEFTGGGDTTLTGDLIPATDNTYDIGLAEESAPEYTLKIEQALNNGGGTVGITLRGTTFTPVSDFNLGKVTFMLNRAPAGSGMLTAHISATSEGVPTGGDLVSVTIDGSTITDDGFEWVTFELETPYALTGSVMYALWLSVDAGSSYTQRFYSGTVYDGGTYIQYSPPWVKVDGYEGTFQIYSVGGTEYTYTRWQDLYLSGVARVGSVAIPDAGWIGSYTTSQAIQIEADGDVVVPNMFAVTGDLQVTGNILLMTENGGVGYSDNSPMLVFNNASNLITVTGNIVMSDDATIGIADGIPRILFDDTQGDVVIGGDLLVNAGSLKSGIADTTRGYLYLYGGASGFGGSAYFHVPANSDDVINSYVITPYEDDLRIGTNVDGNIITITAGSAVGITTTLNVTGTITASNYTAANLLTACATSAGGLDFSSAVTLTVAETETTTNYHTDTRAATWLAANHETTYTHTDIALNTTHRGLVAGNPHVVTPTELSLVIGTNTQAHGDVLDDLNTLGANVNVDEFLVGTAAGALAWESGDTARISLGVGSTNVPTFYDLNITHQYIYLGTTGSGLDSFLEWKSPDVGGTSVYFRHYSGWFLFNMPEIVDIRTGAGCEFRLDVGANLIVRDRDDSYATRFTLDSATGDIKMEGTLKLKERAAAIADTVAYGQLWVKDTAPCGLWFTDDAGTDHQIAYV